MKVKFKLEGLSELEAVLKDLAPQVASRAADGALRKAVQPIIDEAKRLVPVDQGDLRDSITSSPPKRQREGARERLIGFKPPVSRRAHLTEFGTSKQPAQPFMRPALDAKAGEALEVMRDALARATATMAERAAGIKGSRRRR